MDVTFFQFNFLVKIGGKRLLRSFQVHKNKSFEDPSHSNQHKTNLNRSFESQNGQRKKNKIFLGKLLKMNLTQLHSKKQQLTGIQALRALKDKAESSTESKPPSNYISYENHDFVKSSISSESKNEIFENFKKQTALSTVDRNHVLCQKKLYLKTKAAREMKFKKLLCDLRLPKINSKNSEKDNSLKQQIHSS